MSKPTIILDLDGVIVDFVDGVRRRFGLPETWTPTEWDFYENIGVDAADFYRRISDEEFWLNLEPYPWINWLIDNVQCHAGKMLFWTSPILSPHCHSAKARWFAKRFGESSLNLLIIGSHKHLAAKRDVVLIDDSDDNIAKFRKHGGLAITFPQPWNANREVATSDESRIKHVTQKLEILTCMTPSI